jgi:hypothetical protein
MTRLLHKFACGLFLIVSLGGCPAAGTGGGAANAPSGLSDAGVQETTRETSDVTNTSITRPHPGGVTSPGAEVGDEDELIVEGTAQPVCRLSSGDVHYRIQGSVAKVHGDGSKGGICLFNEATGQYMCAIDNLTLRFWNGKSCQSEDLPLTVGKFERGIAAGEISDLSVAKKSVRDLQASDLHKIPSPSGESVSEPSDITPAVGSLQEVATKINVTANQDTLAATPGHPFCGLPPESEDVIKGNRFEIIPIDANLPACPRIPIIK